MKRKVHMVLEVVLKFADILLSCTGIIVRIVDIRLRMKDKHQKSNRPPKV
ncbi:MAG TPA: hypothetical protein VJZ01_04810 [Lachnospiraceae bacterium]|jgi:hypothetical protein|nr:hypothetical protein [Lachnospiraceae bacterium]